MAESSSEERMCIPESLSFDKLNLVLIAYLKAGADRKAVSYRDASIRSGVTHTRVSANNKFFAYAGFLGEEGKGRFRLTEDGAKYAQLLDWGRLEEAKTQLRKILKDCSLINIVLDYVAINNEVTRDDLRRKIGSVAEVSRARRFTVGINAFIDMLAFSELLHEENEMFRRGKEITEGEIPSKISVTEEPEKTIAKTTPSFRRYVVTTPKAVSVPISLTVNITDDTDIQKLREILRAIKEELWEKKETESQD